MLLAKPIFWDLKKPNLISKFLTIFSNITILINNLRFNKIKIENIKTICVGNIYLGGTGKTPTCIYINKILKNLGKKTTFIKKQYVNQLDEQLLLKKNGNLICKPKRIDAIRAAKSKKFKFAICDDGLQDKNIDYDYKIVCFNSEVFVGNGLVIPAGPLREQLENLKNYHAVIINGNGDNLKKHKNLLKKFNKNLKIFEGRYVLDNSIKKLRKKKLIVFSGIGNHSTFINTLKKNNIKIFKSLNFPDHYDYTDQDIIKIKKLAHQNNCSIITTEKDILRLNNKNKKNIHVFKIKIEIDKKKEFINCLKKI